MQLIPTEEQALLAETAKRFVAEHATLARFRKQRGGEPYSLSVWTRMAEMGWQGMIIPEEYAGFGLGMAELTIVFEALGRNLATEPLWSTVLLAGEAIRQFGTEAQRANWLPEIAGGGLVATVAHSEPKGRYDLYRCATAALPVEGGFSLEGTKAHVLDGSVADLLLVVARTSGQPDDRDGLTVFAVDPKAAGVTVTRHRRVDERDAATVELDGVVVGEESVIGGVGDGADVLDGILDRALVGLAAELVGAATHAMEMTLSYMRERVQFGVAIATFQALQHRMARVFIQVELARSAVLGAARALDEGSELAPAFASMAKAKATEALEIAAKEGIQFFGGVGMTDEYDIGFYLKRHRGADATLGDRGYHLKRWATLRGY